MFKLFYKFSRKVKNKPLVRGMAVYSLTWPLSSYVQQCFEADRKSMDYKRMMHFSIYGTFYVAPSLYAWMTFSCYIWPKQALKYAFLKAAVEQITYAPFAMCSFFSIMTLLDGGTLEDAKAEVSKKLLPTWKVGVVVWPTIQTVNYMFISEKNRVPVIAVCSLAWTIFLTFVKYSKEDASDTK